MERRVEGKGGEKVGEGGGRDRWIGGWMAG